MEMYLFTGRKPQITVINWRKNGVENEGIMFGKYQWDLIASMQPFKEVFYQYMLAVVPAITSN